MGYGRDFQQWANQNKLKAVGYLWGGCVATTFAYQWTRPIPTQLKIIHTRMYAQGVTLAALGAVAASHFFDEGKASPGSSQDRAQDSIAGVAVAK